MNAERKRALAKGRVMVELILAADDLRQKGGSKAAEELEDLAIEVAARKPREDSKQNNS